MSRLPMIVVAAVRHSTAAVLTCFFVSPMHSDTIGTTSSIADRVRRERVEREGARLPRLLAVHRTEQRALDHAERIVDRNERRDDRERAEALRRKRRAVDLSKISKRRSYS